MPEEPPTTRQRAARAPAWAWVAITLMALLVMSGLITLAVARNANPSTPEAVEDAQTLITELEALNGYLATTNQLMSNAIASAEQLSAAAQAKLAGLSEKLADAEPARRTGARASWRPALRDDALRARQGSAAASVSAADSRAADRAARRATARDDQRGCRRPRRQGRRRYGQSRERERGSDRGARGQAGRDRAVQGSAPGRGRPAQGGGRAGQGGRSGPAGGHSGPAGACARRRCSDPTAEADRGGAPADRRQAELAAALVSASS